MTTSLAFRADTRVFLIDLTRTEPTDDPQGSRDWFNRAKMLEFNSPAEPMDTLQQAPTGATTVDAPGVTSFVTGANALVVAVRIPIDRNDHVCC
ncbi:hypothetical protein AWC03_19395 [Mycobacterium europaeum]|uniref:hypothetical protein n=1 Tax=Mycobacterium europaeum TaxID=761804 RepID=UPI000A152D87|nr:hypothetical protein [Mycobacterium europaeum]ORV53722.1 hypothetical protein AWC03_19395 [Mycobacterium europaeum]